MRAQHSKFKKEALSPKQIFTMMTKAPTSISRDRRRERRRANDATKIRYISETKADTCSFYFHSIWPNLNEHDKYLKLKTTDRFAVPKDVSYHFSLNEYLNRLIGSWPFFTLSDANYVW